MNYVVIELKAETASFRNPEFQNYHKSYLLPPPSTLIGLTGAAIGLSPKGSQEFIVNNDFMLGCYGKPKGKANDLWKYLSIKPQKGKDRSSGIVSREILYAYHLIVVFGNEDGAKIESIINGFVNPKYALTLGNSDSLAKVIKITQFNNSSKSRILSNCLVEGNVIEEVIQNSQNGIAFEIHQTSDPIAYDMPVTFNYGESEYGSRSVKQRKVISIIGQEMTLNIEKEGIEYDNVFIPVFKLKE